MIDPKDAPGIKVPVMILASGDEKEDDVRNFVSALNVAHHCETFEDQVHVSSIAILRRTCADKLARGGWLHGTLIFRSLSRKLG